MASVESVCRANIRIEIENDFTEEMEVCLTEENNSLSEGEVEDDETDIKIEEQEMNKAKAEIFFNPNIATNRKENLWTTNDGGFTTGVDIFGKEVQEKLHSRAQRFGLDPNDCKSMTDQQLQELHESLGITEEDKINTRFEAIHMYGTKEMSTQDVFGYFGKYGPSSIEWINDESCNVVWFDKVSAARAFHGLSTPIDGMPVKGSCNPFKNEDSQTSENKESGRSILLIAKNREVELYDENLDERMVDDLSQDSKDKSENFTHVSDIPIPVPPGYWRLGVSHPKAEYVLLRFARRSDKKPLRAEKFSEYYKKYGNPNYGGIRGLISESKKRKMKGFSKSDSEDVEQTNNPTEEIVKGNPWGNLAKNWNNDVCETFTEISKVPYAPKPSKSILERLGSTCKRSHEDVENSSNGDNEKKSKVPRMRMYADDEEAKIEKAKQLKRIRTLEKIEEIIQKNKNACTTDLRNRIGKQNVSKYVDKSVTLKKIIKPILVTNFKFRSDKLENMSVKQRLQRSETPDLSEDELNVQQRSKVTVIVKKPNKPTMASTIWSRLDREKHNRDRTEEIKTNNGDKDSNSEKSIESELSDMQSDDEKSNSSNRISKTVNDRPGFSKGNLKSRLGLNTEHKSPLRIEINNDHYKKS